MDRMVPVDEWAEIHGKTHATVMRKIYATTADGVVICMVTCTKHTHIACGVTADEMNDLWKAPPAARSAAQAALQYGWLHPLADPRSYNEKGERLQNVYNRKK